MALVCVLVFDFAIRNSSDDSDDFMLQTFG